MSTPESHFDKSYGYSEHHKDYHEDGPARPGYFKCDDYLVRRTRKGGDFERWGKKQGQWEVVPDDVYILQNAQRITAADAEKLAAEHGSSEPLTPL